MFIVFIFTIFAVVVLFVYGQIACNNDNYNNNGAGGGSYDLDEDSRYSVSIEQKKWWYKKVLVVQNEKKN